MISALPRDASASEKILRIKIIKMHSKEPLVQLSVRVTAAELPPTMACPLWRSLRSTPPQRTSSTGKKRNPY